MRLVGLTSGGSWSNPQYVGEAPDPTGLTFTANYSDGSSDSCSPQSLTPPTWENTGTQTATFTYTEDGVSASCEVEANVQAAPEPGIPTITSVSVSGEQLNCNVQAGRFRPKGLIFSFTADNGDVITTASSETATGEVDYNWTRSDARADQGCAITIDDITGDPTSIVTYEASSSYFMGVGSVALTVRPNPECECFGGYDIDPNASTTLNLNVINNYHLVGSIDDSLQIEGQAPDLTGATLYAYSSGDDKDPQTGLPTSNGNQISNPEFDPTVYSTTGTQTLSIRSSNTSTWGPVPMTTTVDVQPGTPVSTPTVTSISISGTPPTQHVGDVEDYTGCTFTFGLDNGQSVVKTWTEIVGSWMSPPEIANNDAANTGLLDPDDGYKYVSTAVGTHTVTWEPDIVYWENEGYLVASPAPTGTIQITVEPAQ